MGREKKFNIIDRRIIFPLGNYKAVWSPYVIDLYGSTDPDMVPSYLENYKINDDIPWSNKMCENIATKSMKYETFIKNDRFLINMFESLKKFKEYGGGKQDAVKYWKLVIENKVLPTYKETSVDKIQPNSFKCEVVIKCKKYYSIMFPSDDDYKLLKEKISQL
jgi:hypothetical protein